MIDAADFANLVWALVAALCVMALCAVGGLVWWNR